MQLLIITNNPDRASFRQRVGVYLEAFRENGIACEVAKLPSGFFARRRLFKRAREFDGVFLHKKGLNFFDARSLRKHSRKIIYNYDDAIMYSDKRPDRDSRAHFVPFRRSVSIADMVIVGSSYLAEYATPFNANVHILPIGLNVSDYKPANPPQKDGKIRLVWIGSKSTLAYLADLKPVLEKIGSRFDHVVLRIICDEFFDLENMPVEKRRWAKETRCSDMNGCHIGLAPLPSDRFTRGKCSFKVLEYASAGLPVVASPIGTNADHVRDNITGFLATRPQEWINRLAQLIEDEDLRSKMGREAQRHAQNFDVGIIGKRFSELLKQGISDSVS
jgi:glycosyltransferase involved in cell wall biosynthesis